MFMECQDDLATLIDDCEMRRKTCNCKRRFKKFPYGVCDPANYAADESVMDSGDGLDACDEKYVTCMTWTPIVMSPAAVSAEGAGGNVTSDEPETNGAAGNVTSGGPLQTNATQLESD